MSLNLINSYLKLKTKIKEQQEILAALKKEEREISTEIEAYINQSEEQGIKIDENTILALKTVDKKINRSKKEYRSKLEEICYDQGLEPENVIDEILNAKVQTIVQHQRLKLIKTK